MSEVIEFQNRFYILATEAVDPDRTRVLKHADAFLVCDRFGDVRALGVSSDGLFHEGTRFLSRFELRIAGQRPLLLSSTLEPDNAAFVANLTNPDLDLGGGRFQRDTVHLLRTLVLWEGQLHQELRFRSFAAGPVELDASIEAGADFRDIFEVRGAQRARRGTLAAPLVEDGHALVLGYLGLDGVARRTRITSQPRPASITGALLHHRLVLRPEEEVVVRVTAACEVASLPAPVRTFGVAARAARTRATEDASRGCAIRTSNVEFNAWLDRSRVDLAMMTTDTRSGLYPYAGVPWFCCPFGRDALVTAFETLWMDPALTRGVLRFLADTQATESDPVRDADPGKILHEARLGEMPALGEVPFGRYYGSADATPLFVALASAYWRRTGDVATIEALWPHLERALAWIDRYGDADGDGFVEYAPRLPSGLRHQGWKDSEDSVSHADGALALGPIALCEIQAYVYAARLGAASLAEVLGCSGDAQRLRDEAAALRRRFAARFWCEDLGTYALALDGDKRPCKVRSSNAGQCLFAGIAEPEHAAAVARTLDDPTSFSGWGVRTLATGERRYNPMSYHNGSVWPHDNALIAAGLARYRLREESCRILRGLFDASRLLPLRRLPELFCGFPRRANDGPTLYPVACAPQAWSAGAAFLAIAATIGLSVDAVARRVTFDRPMLPDVLDWLEIRGLAVGDATLDLTLHRHREDVGLTVQRRDGDVEVVALQ